MISDRVLKQAFPSNISKSLPTPKLCHYLHRSSFCWLTSNSPAGRPVTHKSIYSSLMALLASLSPILFVVLLSPAKIAGDCIAFYARPTCSRLIFRYTCSGSSLFSSNPVHFDLRFECRNESAGLDLRDCSMVVLVDTLRNKRDS